MGFSNGCKVHPDQEQKQGVCPSCLRERLSRLSSIPYNNEASRVAPYYPSNSSSPARRRISYRRSGSGAAGIVRSSSFVVKVGHGYGLKKSHTIAFVPRKMGDEDVQSGDNKKRIRGFWSKLLRLKGKKKDVVVHSSSMRL